MAKILTLDEVVAKCKSTVGYNEASNKTSFIVGAQVSFDKCSEVYLKEIAQLKTQVDGWKSAYESVKTDMVQLTNIIKKHS